MKQEKRMREEGVKMTDMPHPGLTIKQREEEERKNRRGEESRRRGRKKGKYTWQQHMGQKPIMRTKWDEM